jgi:hypothetical protein
MLMSVAHSIGHVFVSNYKISWESLFFLEFIIAAELPKIVLPFINELCTYFNMLYRRAYLKDNTSELQVLLDGIKMENKHIFLFIHTMCCDYDSIAAPFS